MWVTVGRFSSRGCEAVSLVATKLSLPRRSTGESTAGLAVMLSANGARLADSVPSCRLAIGESRPSQARLKDKDLIVRVNAVTCLGRIGTETAIQRILSLLDHDTPWMRRAAAHAVGIAKASACVAALIRAMADPDDEVGIHAIWALGQIGPKASAAIPALEKALAGEKPGGSYHITEALAKIRQK